MIAVVHKMLDKYKRVPIQAKASVWFVICSIMQRGIAFITVPIFTRLMTTEQYGAYSTYLSWYGILIVFTSLNLYYGVFNNAMVKYENQRDRYISSMQGLTVIITIAFFAIYFVFQDVLNSFLGMTTPLVLLLFIELLVTPALQFWTVHCRFNYKYKIIVIVTLLKSIINPLLGVVFVLCSEQKDIARIISTVLVEVIVCGMIAVYQFSKGKCFFDKAFWKYAVLFNLPLIPHYLSGSILNQADRIMINKLVSDSAVAFYSVAYNIGLLMNLFTSAINSSFTPWIYQQLQEKKTDDIKHITNLLLIFMAALVTLLMFLAPEILYLLASKEYAEAVYVIPPVAASVFFIFMYNIFANVEFFFEERRYVTIGSVLAAVANLLLNWIFIPIFGYYAAGYTTLVCYIIYGLSHLFFTKLIVKKNLGIACVFDSKAVIGITVVVVLITILQNFLYSHIIIRYLLIIGLVLIAFAKRKMVVGLIKGLRKR